jgi:DNA-binding PadR family transcriptional regulator
VSRGLGRIQRAIIDRCAYAFSESPRELSLAIWGKDTPATRASISRALRPLIAAGYIDHHWRPSPAVVIAICGWHPSLVHPDRKLFKLTRKGCKAFQLWRSEGSGGAHTWMRDRVFPRNASAKQRAELRESWRREPDGPWR